MWEGQLHRERLMEWWLQLLFQASLFWNRTIIILHSFASTIMEKLLCITDSEVNAIKSQAQRAWNTIWVKNNFHYTVFSFYIYVEFIISPFKILSLQRRGKRKLVTYLKALTCPFLKKTVQGVAFWKISISTWIE